MVEAAEYYLMNDEEQRESKCAAPSEVASCQTSTSQIKDSVSFKDSSLHSVSQSNLQNLSSNSFCRPTASRLMDDFESFDLNGSQTSSFCGSSANSGFTNQSSLHSFCASKTSPQTLKWLLDNFEGSEGVSLPRATLYALYMQHCNEDSVEAMNAASFGKMLRSIFSGLRTRRLGTRGNSKYHYYGIKLKQNSILQKRLTEISKIKPLNDGDSQSGKKTKNSMQKHLIALKESKSEAFNQSINNIYQKSKNINFMPAMKVPNLPKNFFDSPDLSGFSKEDVMQFYTLYQEHFEASISAINNHQFEYLCAIWNAFWRHPSIDNSNTSHQIIEQRLPKFVFNEMCCTKPIIKFVYDADNAFYEMFADYIFPNMSCGFDDITILNLKNATCDLQGYLRTSTIHLPQALSDAKQKALDNFLVHIKDLSSMFHSIESVKAIFKSRTCLSQARSDFLLLDLKIIKKKVKDFSCTAKLFQKFDELIEPLFSSEDLISDIENSNVVEELLRRIELMVQDAVISSKAVTIEKEIDSILKPNSDTENSNSGYDQNLEFVKDTKKIYVEWCMYSSLILREMTLKGACSFGIFQLVRTLIDDYIMYCIKIQIGKIYGKPSVCAMSDIELTIGSTSQISVN